MKLGVRKPSLKKSIKARTTGALKRKIKRAANPLYGKKGMGLLNDPKKALYNKVYQQTTVDSLSGVKKAPQSESKPKVSADSKAKGKPAPQTEKTISDTPLIEITGSTGKAILFPDRIIIEKRPILKKIVTTIPFTEIASVVYRIHDKIIKQGGFLIFNKIGETEIDYSIESEILMKPTAVACSDKTYNESLLIFCSRLTEVSGIELQNVGK